MFSTPLKACRLCTGTDLSEVLSLSPTPAGDHYLTPDRHPEKLPVFPLSLFQCRRCGHVQLGAIVDPDYLYSEYIYVTSSSLGLAEHFKDYAKKTAEKLNLKPGSLVVEIGSNDGTMLRAFQDLGMRVVGVDPAREIAQKATASGVRTINAYFSSEIAARIVADEGPALLVIANNVMANVNSPREVVEAVKMVLDPQGVFVFETGYSKYLTEDCVFDNIYHEHIDYYAVAPLVRFFQSLGMRLFDVHVSASKGSSIRCYADLAEACRSVAPGVGELVLREKQFRYQEPEPYERLSRRLLATKNELQKIVAPAIKRGEKIAGFGASVGVTTVLYHFELGHSITLLIDDNPARQGLASPGLGLPVCSPEILYAENRPDRVLLLAWRYAEAIVGRHSRYARDGGQFVRILPEVSTVEVS